MEFHIPFTFSDIETLKKKSNFIRVYIKTRGNSKLQNTLSNNDINLSHEDYLAICIRHCLISFLVLYIVLSTILFFMNASKPFLLSLGISFAICFFMFFSQINYPKLYNNRKQRNIEKNLIPALCNILVQLNSGIPLFSILVNISSGDYGALGMEFKKAVKKINAGYPEVEVLEELGEKNDSIFFKRTLWQISNGMKAGSDISIVIKESIKFLTEEQLIQIQNYGNKLNPLVMFYMLISVILPALAITFLTIIASLVSLDKTAAQTMFIVLFIFVILIQNMFLGVIKSMRPSLL